MRDRRVKTGRAIAWAIVISVAGALAMGGALLRAQAPQGPPPPPKVGPVQLEPVDGSTTASYRVSEQFVGVNFPTDATGMSSVVTGMIYLNADGTIDSSKSKLDFDLKSMKSNEDLRDNYVRTRTLEVDKFPMVEFIPRTITGIPTPMPNGGAAGFQLAGDMTIHGVTKPVTWSGVTTFTPALCDGRAKTDFTFATFGLTKPMIGRLLSVGDKIQLEVIFKMKRS